jgi:hypothetical protein
LKTHLFGVNEFLSRIGEDTYDNIDKKDISLKQKEKKIKKEPKVNSKEEQQQIKKLETKVRNAERKITDLEEKIANKTKELESADFNDTEKYEKIVSEFNELKSDLEKVESAWENAELELEGLK